ncbi:MAG: DUF3365 domain-containing protein [Desulfobacterales bacterium]|nr:DUF3365 domain-containing protein [Desulfobacterales bacterium]
MKKIRSRKSFQARFTKLPNKFLVVLAGILLCFSGMTAFFMYSYQKRNLVDRAFQETELIMQSVSAMRGYVSEVLRPKMYEELGHDSFVVEAMSSSYISREVMERLKKELPDFVYRRVAIKARNPQFEATPEEIAIMDYFNEHPAESSWQGIIMNQGRKYYMRFTPVRYKESCLHCHGDPDDAPPSIIQRYDDNSGFSKDTDTFTSVVSIGIPVESGLERIRETTVAILFMVLFVTVLLYLSIWFFFNRLIVQNLHGVLDLFWANLRDDEGKKLYEQSKKMDEIGELVSAAGIISDHLQKTHQQLRDYTDNLELKVSERTKALSKSEKLLREKVRSRNEELFTLNTITELLTQPEQLKKILPRVLGQILKVIPAAGAGIYLLSEDPSRLDLQCQLNAEELDLTLYRDIKLFTTKSEKKTGATPGESCEKSFNKIELVKGKGEDSNHLVVPLCCHEQILGVMTLIGINIDEVTPELRELLLSVGRQLGVTLENAKNLDGILQSKGLLQSVFNAITDLVVLLGGDGNVRMVNEALLGKYALNPEDVLGCPIEHLAERFPAPFSLFTRALPVMIREPVTEQACLQDGSIFELQFFPVFDEKGAPDSIVCYAKDITHQKQAEQNIQQTEKMVAIGQLAAGIAHEVNNPLGIILCYADLLKEDLADRPKQLSDLGIIEKHARNCHRIVNDLLLFARSQKTEKIPASINDCIQSVVEITCNQFRKARIDLLLDLQDDLPKIHIDPRKMKQVFMNMFINTFQAMEGKGFIRIITRHRKETAQIEIKIEDNGQGIDREVLDKIFDPFFTTKKPGEGTGLGLSLSYGIIQEHDGDIHVESIQGQGTTFTITLPAAAMNNRERN